MHWPIQLRWLNSPTPSSPSSSSPTTRAAARPSTTSAGDATSSASGASAAHRGGRATATGYRTSEAQRKMRVASDAVAIYSIRRRSGILIDSHAESGRHTEYLTRAHAAAGATARPRVRIDRHSSTAVPPAIAGGERKDGAGAAVGAARRARNPPAATSKLGGAAGAASLAEARVSRSAPAGSVPDALSAEGNVAGGDAAGRGAVGPGDGGGRGRGEWRARDRPRRAPRTAHPSSPQRPQRSQYGDFNICGRSLSSRSSESTQPPSRRGLAGAPARTAPAPEAARAGRPRPDLRASRLAAATDLSKLCLLPASQIQRGDLTHVGASGSRSPIKPELNTKIAIARARLKRAATGAGPSSPAAPSSQVPHGHRGDS